jgi:hypothetical protein
VIEPQKQPLVGSSVLPEQYNTDLCSWCESHIEDETRSWVNGYRVCLDCLRATRGEARGKDGSYLRAAEAGAGGS